MLRTPRKNMCCLTMYAKHIEKYDRLLKINAEPDPKIVQKLPQNVTPGSTHLNISFWTAK